MREQNDACISSAEREEQVTKAQPKGNVPALRFPEFTDEWKKSRLSDFATKITKKNKGNVVKNVLCNSANLGLVPQDNYFDREIANTENTNSYYVIKNGDFVYNPRKSTAAPFGPVNIYEGEKIGIISPLYLCFSVHNIYPKFLYYRFKSSVWHPYVYAHGDSGVRFDRVSIKDDVFFNMPICEPTQEEQIKIAALLQLIDERISTQNKIIEDLKKLKSAIVEKLYSSANGKTYSFRQIFDVVNEKNKKLTYSNVLSASQELGMIERSDINIDIKFEQGSIIGYKIVRKGDYVVHLRSFQGGFAFSDRTGICSPAYTILRPNDLVAYGYLSHFFTSRPFIKSLKLVTYGIRDGRSINVDEWLDMTVILPTWQEQLHIISVINSIDNKLSNENQIHNCLLRQKTYLQKMMFI